MKKQHIALINLFVTNKFVTNKFVTNKFIYNKKEVNYGYFKYYNNSCNRSAFGLCFGQST